MKQMHEPDMIILKINSDESFTCHLNLLTMHLEYVNIQFCSTLDKRNPHYQLVGRIFKMSATELWISVTIARFSQYTPTLDLVQVPLYKVKICTKNQNQVAHSTNKLLTAQTNTLTAPRNRGVIFCLFLDLKKEEITCPW